MLRRTFNYIYGGDINNDGSGTNDLILYQQQHTLNNGFSTNGSSSPAAKSSMIIYQSDSYLSGRGSMRSAMEHFLLGEVNGI
jgi:hypothetical protein